MVCTYAAAVENAWRSDTRCIWSWIGSARTHRKLLGSMQEQGKADTRSLLNASDSMIESPYAHILDATSPGHFTTT